MQVANPVAGWTQADANPPPADAGAPPPGAAPAAADASVAAPAADSWTVPTKPLLLADPQGAHPALNQAPLIASAGLEAIPGWGQPEFQNPPPGLANMGMSDAGVVTFTVDDRVGRPPSGHGQHGHVRCQPADHHHQ